MGNWGGGLTPQTCPPMRASPPQKKIHPPTISFFTGACCYSVCNLRLNENWCNISQFSLYFLKKIHRGGISPMPPQLANTIQADIRPLPSSRYRHISSIQIAEIGPIGACYLGLMLRLQRSPLHDLHEHTPPPPNINISAAILIQQIRCH